MSDVIYYPPRSASETDPLALKIASNLSDLQSVATAKSNLSLVKADVGLANVDNTSDADKPVSSAMQTALNLKQDTLVNTTNIKSVNGQSLLGAGDLQIGGGVTLAVNSDVSNTTTTYVELTDLAYTFEAGKTYHIRGAFNIVAISGIRLSMETSPSGSFRGFWTLYNDAAKAINATGGVASPNTTSHIMSSNTMTDTINPGHYIIDMFFKNTVSRTFIVEFMSLTNGQTSQIREGSTITINEVA